MTTLEEARAQLAEAHEGITAVRHYIFRHSLNRDRYRWCQPSYLFWLITGHSIYTLMHWRPPSSLDTKGYARLAEELACLERHCEWAAKRLLAHAGKAVMPPHRHDRTDRPYPNRVLDGETL